ncbi:MAG: Asp-tRNA(Asn)/Glu-tRNA(Gln) amidotransferase subunit GatA [Dissulfurimicrobium sp.]|uniref:Asp-tRNA(Asn)/Glu-tRNA(Gln) amidotransferase subunit GatA n=1 Tax=Dissulfurimicrobium TaxID=1769732 RepID=UPI001ED9EBB2|nr:Asp-tRNA(Asn)/Glu-tRNA(Gln) amidotransferase subunit GatA [Dissulfurimicrobium hydrothermale]UKL13608.1 Asp-tRNA(Asn)/Glu-tRNA(Gln) amidotransferase subunit GatA [Dissulfurimicrobium hydrothermale]
MPDLIDLTIKELGELYAKGEISPVEVTKAYLDRIDQVDPKIRAYITVTHELALNQAKDAQRRLDKGEDITPLTGVPLGIKDLICTKGIKTTCASRMLEGFIPPYDATAIERLNRAGAVMLGKLNMDEFAMGSSTENSAFHPTYNPWDLTRVPGGSSGGSAAAVAARLCAGALGSDTGGSIRQPSSHCGVVGLKPTYGRVSRYGLVAFASSLDQIGPITKDVTDAAILLGAIAGNDPMDSTSSSRDVPDYTAGLGKGISGYTIGLPREYLVGGLDPDVEAVVRKAIGALEAMGCKMVEVSLPHTEYAIATYYIIATAEAASNLSRYDGVKYGLRASGYRNLSEMYKKTRSEGFGPEVKRRIMLGTYVLSSGYYDAYYKKASQVRNLIKQDFVEAFKRCDCLITPVAPTPAFRLGEKTGDPLQMYLSDVFTIATNLAGVPGISTPCGFSKDGLPIGVQLMADSFEDEKLLRVAYSLETFVGKISRWPEV